MDLRETALTTPEAAVECAPGVLERLRVEAVDGLRRLRGGIEVGGVLFGQRTEGVVRVRAARAFDCEHKFGPSFVLSENDEPHLRSMLDDSKADGELGGLEPLGLYVSHCRHSFELTKDEGRLMDAFFPSAGHVVLVLMPELAAETRAGFFVRAADGTLRPDVCSKQILLPGTRPPEIVVAPVTTVVRAQDTGSPDRAAAVLRFESFLAKQEQHRRVSQWNFGATVAMLAIAAVAVGYWLWAGRPKAYESVPIRVTEAGSQVRIGWDPALEPVRTATAGVLEIRESGRAPVNVTVPPDALRTGSVLYARHSDNLEIRLKLAQASGSTVESVVYFINPEGSAKQASVPVPVQETSAERLRSPVIEAKTVEPPRDDVPPAPKPLRVFHPPSEARPRGTLGGNMTASLPAPPQIQVASPPSLAPVFPTGIPNLVTPPAPVTAKPQDPAQPRRGRLIWTGDLDRGALLSFSSSGASMGWLTGRLPGFPVTVSVHPGDLVQGGIEIYTHEAKRASAAEPPSAGNGWNTVVYKLDAKRTADVQVLEPPSASNGWKQIVLQNGRRRVSVIVIDWERARD